LGFKFKDQAAVFDITWSHRWIHFYTYDLQFEAELRYFSAEASIADTGNDYFICYLE
jgi:hypothetical protein